MKDQKRDLKIVDWPVTVSVSMHVCMQIQRCGSQVPSQDATARSAVAILYTSIYKRGARPRVPGRWAGDLRRGFWSHNRLVKEIRFSMRIRLTF